MLTKYWMYIVFLVSCTTESFVQQPEWDSRQMTVQTLSLFRQHGLDGKWTGDWILRRRRMQLIDKELRQIKPDLLLLQQAMSKGGRNSPESDRRLLKAGALSGDYYWGESFSHSHEKSHEEEAMVTVVGLPAAFKKAPPDVCLNGDPTQCWPLGFDGWAVASTVDFEGEAVAVVNVDMPSQQEKLGHWYGVLKDRVENFLEEERICPKRLIVGGFLPQEVGAEQAQAFRKSLQLVDTAQGFCEQESRCYTATPLNEFYYGVHGDQRPTHADRVFVHKSALIYSGNVNFHSNEESDEYLRSQGLSELWASDRFGWNTVIRLAKCRVSVSPDHLE